MTKSDLLIRVGMGGGEYPQSQIYLKNKLDR